MGSFTKIKTRFFVNKVFFLIALFIIFTILPPISIGGISLHIVAKLLLSIVFMLQTVNRITPNLDEGIMKLFIFFFITNSLSIINASNLMTFLKNYQPYVFSALLVMVVSSIKDKKKFLNLVVNLLILGTAINTIFELTLYLYPQIFRSFTINFFDSNFVNFTIFNLERGRIYVENYSQTIIPLILFLIKDRGTKVIIKALLLILFLVIVFNTITSNNRTFLIMLVFSLVSSLLLLREINLKAIFIVLVTLVFTISIALYSSQKIFQFNIVDRILLTDAKEDIQTMTYRTHLWKIGISLGMANPLTGVGLGNYLDYVPNEVSRPNSSTMSLTNSRNTLSYQNPHNIFVSIFAQTGLLSLVIFMITLFFFLRDDFMVVRTGKSIRHMFIPMFWTLFVFALINPENTFKFQMLFWLSRLIIIGNNKLGKT